MNVADEMLDPAQRDGPIDVTVRLSPDAEIDQNSQLLGETSVAAGASDVSAVGLANLGKIGRS